MNIENLSDYELVEFVNDLQNTVIDENSIVRKVTKQYYKTDMALEMSLVAIKVLFEMSKRFQTYSPYICLEEVIDGVENLH